nr:MAG TPA: hypothetical protein [Caudoviricetes sp.]
MNTPVFRQDTRLYHRLRHYPVSLFRGLSSKLIRAPRFVFKRLYVLHKLERYVLPH